MKRRARAKFPAWCGILCALGPSPAAAAERACSAAVLVSDDELGKRWPDLARRVRSEVPSRNDIDACASITLTLAADTTIRVQVTLADGRAAARWGLRPEDVVPTLQALLLMPEHVLLSTPPAPSPAR